MTGNWFALFALLAWPLVTALLYKFLAFSRATIWTVLGGYLLLPSDVAIKFEMIPALDKYTIPNICAVLGCMICSPRHEKAPLPRSTFLVAATYILSPCVSSALNNDIISIGGGQFLPGVGYYDAGSAILAQTLFFLPFLLGWRYLRGPADGEAILVALVVAGLFYSLPILFEIRFSPQLSAWTYGVFPSSFATEVRYGGFRPVVFLQNGLALAFFVMTTVLAALALWRARVKIGHVPPQGAAAYLAVIVALAKSAGTLLYMFVAGFMVGLTKPRMQILLAIILVTTAFFYPLLRIANVFPTDTLLNIASTVNEERGASLRTRFEQEAALLDRASQRIVFGWGRYGRNRVYSENWGGDISLTDGLWIITMGQFGIVGFLALFGLLSIPVFRAARALRYAKSKSEQFVLSALALIAALTVVEQIPNSSLSPWSWLVAGVLLARTDATRSSQLKTENSKMRGGPIYTYKR